MPHVHMTDRDGNYLDQPADDDPHGWTVMFQTVACDDHVHRTLGWVGDLPSATKVAVTAAALWHPAMRCTPTPAPTSDTLPGTTGVITDVPQAVVARIHAGERLRAEELFELGATGYVMRDDVMPACMMTAARLVELLEAKGVDVVTLITDAGEHNAMRALVRVGGHEVWDKLIEEFPVVPSPHAP